MVIQDIVVTDKDYSHLKNVFQKSVRVPAGARKHTGCSTTVPQSSQKEHEGRLPNIVFFAEIFS